MVVFRVEFEWLGGLSGLSGLINCSIGKKFFLGVE